ncbi:MAG: Stk1 family PASTA domain-containing Ser/Thr kinase [Streptosporangiales bacterium]|nr:Stk1 family PASTA domain-containing Ser/Thr kinase [Streptosporangiales bacterium]
MTQPQLLGDRYELEGVVGRGGMAEVYRARDIRLDRVVGIKTLRADLAQDATFQARFRREAQSAASLNHPSIVAVYDTGEDTSSGVPVPYIVMEFVDGQTVRDLMNEGSRLTPERTLEIIGGTLRALEYSHQAGIVHRDIKPGNVMVTRKGDIKVMDFGIARAMNDSQATMTQTAQVIGTAQYLSPEQARGERVDARSDLYSTGCLMYELLTGRPPFQGDSPVAIAYQHVRENPIPPSQVNPELPPWADAIVLKSMAKARDDRYQSAAEMAADIQRAASGMQVAAVAPSTRLDNYYTGGYPGQTQAMGGTGPMAAGGHTATIPPYQQGAYEGYDGYGPGPSSGGGRKSWIPWLIGALVVVAAIVVAALMLTSGHGNAFVPQVDGMSKAQAFQRIKSAGFNPVEADKSSSSVPRGSVIGTNPANGSSVAKGSTVTVDVSSGKSQVQVPQITQGQTLQSAENAVSQAGLVPVVKQDETSTQPDGTIDHTSPGSGTQVTAGSNVTLFVSGGGVSLQNFVGQPADTAKQQLESQGLQVEITYQADSSGSFAPNTVWSQTPSSGTVPAGSKVTLMVQPQAASSPNPTAPTGGATPTGNPTGGTPTGAPTGSTPTAPSTTPAAGGSTPAPTASPGG